LSDIVNEILFVEFSFGGAEDEELSGMEAVLARALLTGASGKQVVP
jgi:hypothetical protein